MAEVHVTVVIPHFEQHEEISLTLEALRHQTHPASHLQVVVADDGSSREVHAPSSTPYDLVVVTQTHEGFGLARARNRGAEAADGDVLIFLDADMLPEPEFVAQHAAAVAAVDHLVSIGHRIHVDASGVSASDLGAAAQAEQGFATLFGRRRSEPGWRADHLARTRDLESESGDAYRLASGGNLSLWRRFYWDCGGTDGEFRQWGGEDLEFAFRATQHGARFTYTRGALAWHQGLDASTDAVERRSQAEQRPLLANRVADGYLRGSRSGRTFTVPHLAVELDATAPEPEQVEAFVDELLRHPLGSTIRITGVTDESRAKTLERAYASDSRVELGSGSESLDAVISPPPIRAFIDMAEMPAAAAVFAGVERLRQDPRIAVVWIGSRSGVYSQQLASRLRRDRPVPTSSRQFLTVLADVAGGDQIGTTAAVASRPPAASADGADALRELWWRMSPTQRRFVERVGRAGVAAGVRIMRLRRRP